MDLLRIDDKDAYFSLDGAERKLVSQVTNEDIRGAVELLLETDDIGIADGEDSSVIANPAQKIVFEQLRMAFKEIVNSRETILGEINATFAAAETKYLNQEVPSDE